MKYRAVVIGAGRIGAGYEWGDLEYTHAGAYRALADRVELVGFVEPEIKRAQSAKLKWEVPAYEDIPTAMAALKPDVVSVCVQPDQQQGVLDSLCLEKDIKGLWVEKPFVWKDAHPEIPWVPIQVNYMRRGDDLHRAIAEKDWGGKLIVYGKDDIHTRCHFEDLAKFWDAELVYRTYPGPCAYVYQTLVTHWFDNGGVDGGRCFKNMLGNLLDHIDFDAPLWSPAT